MLKLDGRMREGGKDGDGSEVQIIVWGGDATCAKGMMTSAWLSRCVAGSALDGLVKAGFGERGTDQVTEDAENCC